MHAAGERTVRIRKVEGSIPFESTKMFLLKHRPKKHDSFWAVFWYLESKSATWAIYSSLLILSKHIDSDKESESSKARRACKTVSSPLSLV